MKTESFHEFCKRQAMRLAGTRNFPKPEDQPEAFVELVRALESKITRSAEQNVVQGVIEKVLDTCEFCPTVADLCRIAGEVRADLEGKPGIPERCASCPRDDWEVIQGTGASGVKRHGCERGRALALRDKQAWADLDAKRKLPEYDPTNPVAGG